MRTVQQWSRFTSVGAATALVAGLSITGGAPAQAAPAARGVHTIQASQAAVPGLGGPVRYECTGPLGLVKVKVTLDVTNLPDGVPTELEMPGGIAVDINVDLPVRLFDGILGGALGGVLGGVLGTFGGTGLIDDFSLTFGNQELPVDPVVGEVDDAESDPVVDTDSSTDEFDVPAPGEYDVEAPESFSFSPLSILGISLFSVDCTVSSASAVVEEVVVDEQESDVDTGVVTDGSTPVAVTKVTRELGERASGKVVAHVGKKILSTGKLSNGVARLPLKHLDAGTKKVSITYLGNRFTDPSTATVRVPRR